MLSLVEKPSRLREFLKQFWKHFIFGVQTALAITLKKCVHDFFLELEKCGKRKKTCFLHLLKL